MAKAEAPTNGDLHKSLMNSEKATEAVEKAEEKPEDDAVPYFQLYNSAERFDYLLMAIGTVGACGNGIAWPLFAVIFKDFTDTFGNPGADFMSDIRQIALSFVWLALGSMVGSYLQASMWMWAGNRQTSRLRRQYLQAVLRQNVAYFDTQATTGTLLQGLNSDSAAVEAAISEKTGHFIQHCTTFIAGIIVAFVGGWDMTLVMVGTMPFLAAAGAVLAKVTAVMSSRTSKAYTDASSLAQQALSQVRTVAAYNGEERTVSSYEKALEMPTNVGIQQSMYTGMALGSVNAVVYFTYALAFYYGAWRVYTGNYTGGQVLQVFVAALLGGFSIGQAAPVLEVFAKGRVAGGKLYAVINRIPEIDPDNTSGRILDKVEGTIELRNVSFAYPARPDAQIFRNFCLTVPAGKTVALVGSSGSGKSTVVQLVERFYDPLGGAVLLDGVDLRSLQVKWLRTQVGLVSQEPTLFATTIFGNIAMGKEGATEAEVQAAAEAANAHTFISHQPKGYQTQVGERGLQMSGGQKQRIAIARAILKNPRIMLLDEATSALDTQSERLVQDALNRMIVGRTTVVVAHRLSTIKDADIIAVVQAGAVVEQGSHQELIANPEGLYGALVKLQMREEAEKAQSMQAGALPEVEEEDGYAEEGGDEEQGKASYNGGTVELGLVGVRNPVNGTSAVEPMVPVPMASELAHAAFSAGNGHANGHTNGHDNALHRASNSHQRPSIGKRPSMEKRLSMDKSSSMQAKDGKEEAMAIIPAEPESDVSFMRIAHLNRPEWRYGLVGLLASAVCGAIQPAFAFIMASFVTVFYVEQGNIMKEASFYSWMFFVVGCATLVATILQQWSFGVMGLQLARRLRVAMMRAMVHNEVGWFDREENSSGVLTTKLGSDASYVRGAVGDTLGLMLQNVLCLAFGYVIALTITGNDSGSSMKFAKANQAVSDAFSSVRVVQAYNLQGQILALYTDLVAGVTSSMRMQSHYTGALMGYSQFSIFAVYGLIIYFGGVEVSSGRVDFEGMLKSFLAILLAAMGIAQAQIGFPDIGKAKDAVKSIFPIIDRKSQIDSSSQEGVTSPPRGGLHLEGQIQLQDVTFRYPARPTVTVFKGFTLDIPAGQTVALVGESGSGKSTIVGLEPLLFSCSVGDNIRYGLPGASQEEVEAAARAANAHDFISALPEGYNTHVGERGVQLSGGQKQRVAIARAVVKNPRIMLLDEATSALDAHAEKVVQDALDHIMVGRTSVVVAHRLSTIRNADKIALVYRGTILEQGTHAELMTLPDGGYARLVAAQNGQRAPTNQGTLPVSKSELAFANAADGQS
ncbi:MDR-like ABC transporter [Haematococcus lacustris]